MAKNCQVSTSHCNTGIINQGRDFIMKGDITITVPPVAKEYIQEFSFPRLNDSFKGRDQELTDLDSLFFIDNIKKIVISGIPGYGKSELAKQFANQCKKNKRIDDIVWIKAENRDYLEKYSAKLRSIYENFKKRKILFVFDNSESRNAINNYEPPDENNFYLLLTSREKDFYDDVKTFEIDSLSPNSAIDVFKAILCKFYSEEYKLLYEKLAKHVNYVPLGLQVTAAYVRQQIKRRGKHFNLSQYVDEIKNNQEKFMDDTIPSSIPNDYKNSLAGAVSLSIDKIQNEENENIEVRNLASKALFDCAYLNPDEITIGDLFKIPNIEELLQTDNNLLVESLSYIDNFCLIRYDPDDTNVSMHRFIQQIVRFYLNKNNPEMKLSCYTACIQFSMRMNMVGWKHGIIWRYTEDDEIMFYDNIYLKIIKQIKDTEKFTEIILKLVELNCVKTLTIIYERDWDNKADARSHIFLNNFLHTAADNDSIDVMQLFIKNYEIDINDESSDPFTWLSTKTPLLGAAKSGRIEAVKYLIQNNANVEEMDSSDGRTLLFILLDIKLKFEDMKEVLELLRHNDKVKINNWGESLVHIAARDRRSDLIEYLVNSYNMDVNHLSKQNHTPVHTLIWYSNYGSREDAIQTLKMLKKCGARLDIVDNKGFTPLQLAEDLTWSGYLIPYLTDTEEEEQVLEAETTENVESTETKDSESLLESPEEHTNSSLSMPVMWGVLSLISSVILFLHYNDMF